MNTYDTTRQFPQTLLMLLQRQANNVALMPINLGGATSGSGGSGTPPGGFSGLLSQRYVTYDTTELAYSGSLSGYSGSIACLVDNLNRMRFWGLPSRWFEPSISGGVLSVRPGIWWTTGSSYIDYAGGNIAVADGKAYLDVNQNLHIDAQFPTASGSTYNPICTIASGAISKDVRKFFNEGGAGGVAGSDTQIQYNNAGAFGASGSFTWNNSTKRLTVGGSIDWSAGNVIFVPLTGDIQTYINDAVAGDTLMLASGQYTITSSITVSKQLNIVGQGNAGFLTAPVTAGHGTLISSDTDAVVCFNITSDNVRIADLSINLTGAGCTDVGTAKNLQGVVLSRLDVIVDDNGVQRGINIYSSDVIIRDVTFYVTSHNDAASGIRLYNDSNSTKNATVDCYNVTGTVVGGATSAYGFVCENLNDANTLTLNIESCTVRALAGTPLDIAVASISTGTSTSTVNCYLSTLEGADFDAYQNNSNVLNLGGSVLVNNLVSGTVTYRAAVAAGLGVFSTSVTAGQVIDSGLTASTAIYANASKQLTSLPAGTVGQVFTSNGSGSAPSWQSQTNWLITGNSGTSSSNFLGTTDLNPLVIKTNNVKALQISSPLIVDQYNYSTNENLGSSPQGQSFTCGLSGVLGYIEIAQVVGAIASDFTLRAYEDINGTVIASGSIITAGDTIGGYYSTRIYFNTTVNMVSGSIYTIRTNSGNQIYDSYLNPYLGGRMYWGGSWDDSRDIGFRVCIYGSGTVTQYASDTAYFITSVSSAGVVSLDASGTSPGFTFSDAVTLSEGASASSAKFFNALTDGNTGGYKAGAAGDVLWYRGAANTWQTPDSLIVDGNVGIGGNPVAVGGARLNIVGAFGVTYPWIRITRTDAAACYGGIEWYANAGTKIWGLESNVSKGAGIEINEGATNRLYIAPGGAVTVAGAFGCNAAAAQTAYASGGALAAYAAGANGLDSGANMSALHALVVKIRAALVANGIMS